MAGGRFAARFSASRPLASYAELGDDAFVHVTAVKENGIERLEDNQRVEFDLAEGRNGKLSVKTLKLID